MKTEAWPSQIGGKLGSFDWREGLVRSAKCAENLAKRSWGGTPMQSSGAGSLSKTPKRQSKSAIVPAVEGLECPHPMGAQEPRSPT